MPGVLYLPELREKLLALKEKYKDLPSDDRDLQALNHLLNFVDKLYGHPPAQAGILDDIDSQGLKGMYDNMASYKAKIAAEQEFLVAYLYDPTPSKPLTEDLINTLDDYLKQLKTDPNSFDFIYNKVNFALKVVINAIPGASKYLKKDYVDTKIDKYRAEIKLMKITVPTTRDLIIEQRKICVANTNDIREEVATAIAKQFDTAEEFVKETTSLLQECQNKRAEIVAARERLQAEIRDKYTQTPITDIKPEGIFNPANKSSPFNQTKEELEKNIFLIDTLLKQLDTNIVRLGDHIENAQGNNAEAIQQSLDKLSHENPNAIPLEKLQALQAKTHEMLKSKQTELAQLRETENQAGAKLKSSQAKYEQANTLLTNQQRVTLAKQDNAALIKVLEKAEKELAEALQRGETNRLPHTKFNMQELFNILGLTEEEKKDWQYRLQRQVAGEQSYLAQAYNWMLFATYYYSPTPDTTQLHQLVKNYLDAARCKQQVGQDQADLDKLQQQRVTVEQEIAKLQKLDKNLSSAIELSQKAAPEKAITPPDPKVQVQVDKLLKDINKYLNSLEHPNPLIQFYRVIRSQIDKDYKKDLLAEIMQTHAAKTMIKGLKDKSDAEVQAVFAGLKTGKQIGHEGRSANLFQIPKKGKLAKILSNAEKSAAHGEIPSAPDDKPPSKGMGG